VDGSSVEYRLSAAPRVTPTAESAMLISGIPSPLDSRDPSGAAIRAARGGGRRWRSSSALAAVQKLDLLIQRHLPISKSAR